MKRSVIMKERCGMVALMLLAVVLGGLATQVHAQAPAAPPAPPPAAPAPEVSPAQAARALAPTTVIPMNSCVTTDCHANIKKYKVVHGPVNVDACDACHKLDDAKTHRFSMAREKAQSCTFCHQIDVKDMAVIHKPVQTGDCTGCHNPHGGSTRKLLRGTSMNQVCNNCHQDVMANKKFVHGPVAAGACDACHQPHASKTPKLLVAEGKDLCFFCHKEMAQQVKGARAKHKPVSDSECIKCHDPHASDFPKQTRKSPLELCTNSSCHQHDPILKRATQSEYKHPVVTTQDACLNCHTAHGGPLTSLLKQEPVKLCMECHSKPILKSGGDSVPAMTEITDPKTQKHGPIRDGTCAGCHEPHGSDIAKLLAKPYPAPFYQEFSLDKYGLCFSCHDSQLVLAKDANGLTNFRNGQENLHYLHVNREKGRNCRSCHAVHASINQMHVRDSVPFGKWTLPINYQKSATGGTCSPGCHKAITYDRNTPLVYDAMRSATGGNPPAAGAEADPK